MKFVGIRRVEAGEALALQAIARETFTETFRGDNSSSSLQKYLKEHLNLEQMQKELATAESAFYFAQQGEVIVGYLKLNQGAAQKEAHLENALEIERIYALASTHGQGVGQALCTQAIENAQTGGFAWLWLGVWEENPRAIRFYEKNGFMPFSVRTFVLGDEAQDDILMRKSI